MDRYRVLWLPAAAVLLPCALIGLLGLQWLSLEREAAARRSADAGREAISAARRVVAQYLRTASAAAAKALPAAMPNQPPFRRPEGLPSGISAAFLFDASGRTGAPPDRADATSGNRAETLLGAARMALQRGRRDEAERNALEIFRCCAGSRDLLGVAYVWYAAWQRATIAGARPEGTSKIETLLHDLDQLVDRGYLGASDDVAQAVLLAQKIGRRAVTAGLAASLSRAHEEVTRREELRRAAARWALPLNLPLDGSPLLGTVEVRGLRTIAAASRVDSDRVMVVMPEPRWLAERVREAGDRAFDVTLSTDGPPADGADLQEALSGEVPSLAVVVRHLPGDPLTDRRRQRLFGAAIGGALLLTLAVGYLAVRDVSREIRIASLRSAFVAGVTHDLKTPLASIRLIAETLRRGRARPDTHGELLDTVVEETDRLGGLIDNVLSASRIESGMQIYHPRLVPLADVVRSAIRRFDAILRGSGFDLVERIDGGDLRVHVDPNALEQSLLNLLSNAIKYSGSSRTIRITAGRTGDQIEISVGDDGVGVPPAEQSRIFEPFYRTREAATETTGVGLGLSLVRHFAAAHGGRVTLHSRPGDGSVFTIWLPMAPTNG